LNGEYILKKKRGEIHVDGELLDNDERKVGRVGCSDHVSLPSQWKTFLVGTVVELSLVRDSEGELCIVISKPKKSS